MAELIKEGWKLHIEKAKKRRYLVKVFEHTVSGCKFSEREYHKRTAESK